MQTLAVIIMKALVCHVFLLFAIISTAQNSLSVEFKQRNNSISRDYHIYHSDSLVHTNCSVKQDSNILNHLGEGPYLVVYNTLFGADSLTIEFSQGQESQSIVLDTEHIVLSKIESTFSEIESLQGSDTVSIKYSLTSCYASNETDLTLIKRDGKYYQCKNNRRKRISSNKIQQLILYEKTIRNLNQEANIDGIEYGSTCREKVAISKNSTPIFSARVNCGDWNKFSQIEHWIK
jgi:hypothetical protein